MNKETYTHSNNSETEIIKLLIEEVKASLNSRFEYSKKFVNCVKCTDKCNFNNNPNDFLQKFPHSCTYRFWQEDIKDKLYNEYSKKIKQLSDEIIFIKNKYSCKRCGICCKFSCLEYSYEEMKHKANNGDEFAQEYIKIFKPITDFSNLEEKHVKFKKYLEKNTNNNKKIFFYRCSKNNENNLCDEYENRPKLCQEFPSNIFCIIPECCGYKGWEEEIQTKKMELLALITVVDYYKNELNKYYP